jgi:hypothetical protein
VTSITRAATSGAASGFPALRRFSNLINIRSCASNARRRETEKLAKVDFDLEIILTTANELKYTRSIQI